MTAAVNDTSVIVSDDQGYARDVADWIERAQADARRTGTLDTRSIVQSIGIIVKALRHYGSSTNGRTNRASSDGSVMDLIERAIYAGLGCTKVEDFQEASKQLAAFVYGYLDEHHLLRTEPEEPQSCSPVNRPVEIERMRNALLAISQMDVLTRPGEQPAQELMRDLATQALAP